ncbi:MAG: hypothetical protein U1E28_02540 [Beijerinckiaceae bacterium]
MAQGLAIRIAAHMGAQAERKPQARLLIHIKVEWPGSAAIPAGHGWTAPCAPRIIAGSGG